MKLLQTLKQNKNDRFQNHTIAKIKEKNIAPPKFCASLPETFDLATSLISKLFYVTGI